LDYISVIIKAEEEVLSKLGTAWGIDNYVSDRFTPTTPKKQE
jgi:hypothetical protein